jgi:hypothetical protein
MKYEILPDQEIPRWVWDQQPYSMKSFLQQTGSVSPDDVGRGEYQTCNFSNYGPTFGYGFDLMLLNYGGRESLKNSSYGSWTCSRRQVLSLLMTHDHRFGCF